MDEKQFSDFQSRMNAMKEVIRINNPEKHAELTTKDVFWAPEMKPLEYTEWVNRNYTPNPNDIVSLSVYSLLMNLPINIVKQKMIEVLEEQEQEKDNSKNIR